MIKYLNGDATDPIVKPALIVHVCNNVGGWGAGFVMAISQKWSAPEYVYRKTFKECGLTLGDVQFVQVEPDIYVCNMIAQNNVRKKGDDPKTVYINYDALDKTLQLVAKYAIFNGLTVHMPRIGCRLAGGSWDKIEPIILQRLADISVYVYDFD